MSLPTPASVMLQVPDSSFDPVASISEILSLFVLAMFVVIGWRLSSFLPTRPGVVFSLAVVIIFAFVGFISGFSSSDYTGLGSVFPPVNFVALGVATLVGTFRYA